MVVLFITVFGPTVEQEPTRCRNEDCEDRNINTNIELSVCITSKNINTELV